MKEKLTAARKIHGMRDGVVSVNAQSDEDISARISDHHLEQNEQFSEEIETRFAFLVIATVLVVRNEEDI